MELACVFDGTAAPKEPAVCVDCLKELLDCLQETFHDGFVKVDVSNKSSELMQDGLACQWLDQFTLLCHLLDWRLGGDILHLTDAAQREVCHFIKI